MRTCEKIFFDSKVGMLEVCFCTLGVHSIHLLSDENKNYDDKIICSALSSSAKIENTLKIVIDWLTSYFESSTEFLRKSPSVCPSVYLDKGDFTIKVWKTLMTQVAFGQTVSYSQLAALCGNENASRAVGSAMKNNPVPLLIPCHRVIKSDGRIGQFSCGKNIKEWLLRHEKASFKM